MKKILAILFSIGLVLCWSVSPAAAEEAVVGDDQQVASQDTAETLQDDQAVDENESESETSGDEAAAETDTDAAGDETEAEESDDAVSGNEEAEQQDEEADEKEDTDAESEDEAPEGDLEEEAGITPDSFLYPLERMLESVQVALTFTDEGKAELLVEFADERLAEAQIMTLENKQELVSEVMLLCAKTLEKANNHARRAVEEDSDAAQLLEKIELVESDAEKVMVKITGTLSEETANQLKQALEAEVQKTLAVQAFATAKDAFFDAKEQFEQAREELKQARQSGDEEAIAAALEKLRQAELYKDEMEQLKDQVEEYKEQVKQELGELERKQEKERKQLKKQEEHRKHQQEKHLQKMKKIEEKIEKIKAKHRKHNAKKNGRRGGR